MIDDQIGGTNRIDLIGIAIQFDDGVSHRGKVHDGRHSRKVLQNNSGRLKGHLHVLLIAILALDRFPVQDVAHILLGHLEVVAVADGRLQEDTNGEGQCV